MSKASVLISISNSKLNAFNISTKTNCFFKFSKAFAIMFVYVKFKSFLVSFIKSKVLELIVIEIYNIKACL